MSGKKNNDVFSEVIVGIFMVAVIALLGYFTIIISGVDVLFGRTRTAATVVFNDVGGLKERDNVVYRGMKVGSVEKITLGASNITVRILIDDDVVLRSGYCCSKRAPARRSRLRPQCSAVNRRWIGCATSAQSPGTLATSRPTAAFAAS